MLGRRHGNGTRMRTCPDYTQPACVKDTANSAHCAVPRGRRLRSPATFPTIGSRTNCPSSLATSSYCSPRGFPCRGQNPKIHYDAGSRMFQQGGAARWWRRTGGLSVDGPWEPRTCKTHHWFIFFNSVSPKVSGTRSYGQLTCCEGSVACAPLPQLPRRPHATHHPSLPYPPTHPHTHAGHT